MSQEIGKNIEIGENDNAEFVMFCLENVGNAISVRYSSGWENFTGLYFEGKKDYFHRVFIVGKSTGEKPVLLEINGYDSMGGGQLTACKEAIQSFRLANTQEKDMLQDKSDSLKTPLEDILFEFEGEEGFEEEKFMAYIMDLREFMG